MNVILTVIREGEPDTTTIFLRSLRKYWGGLVVLATDGSAVYRDEQTLVIRFDELPEVASPETDWFPPNAEFFLFRHLVLLKICAALVDVDGMWVLDARDTCFQADPFQQIFPYDALIFTDEMRPPPAESGPTGGLVAEYYGNEAAAAVGDRPYICVGAIRGTPHGLKLMSEGVLAEYRKLLEHRAVENIVDDQAIVNWLLHRGEIPGRLFENGRGPVLHFSRLSETDVSWGDDGKVNLCGIEHVNRPAILHQYDRLDATRNVTESLYGARVVGRR